MKTNIKRTLVAASMGLSVVLAPAAAYAATGSANTTINAALASSISLSAASSVTINVTPVSAGSQSNTSDTISVSTNNSTGYILQLKDSDATLSLTGTPGGSVPAHSGTFASPTALTNNTWGYNVGGAAGFGTASSESNVVGGNATKYAGITATNVTIKTTAINAVNDTTTVWYAVRVGMATPSGSYTDTVTYTATTN